MTGTSSAGPAASATRTFPDNTADATPTRRRTRTDRGAGDTQADDRIEPTIVDYGHPAGASSAYERLHGLGPEFGEGYAQPQRSRTSRALVMAAVFVVGAGVGLAAAIWLGKPSPQARLSAPPPPSASSRAAIVRGINPSELPYDGVPPPASAPSSVATDASPAVPQVSNEDDGAQQPAADVPPIVPKATKKQDAEGVPKSAKPSGQAGASVASAAPKRKNPARSDREIERIRRQVEEELKKKTDHGRAPGNTRSGLDQGARRTDGSRQVAASISRVSTTRASLARCEKSTNFIRREYCRWQVCSGAWGKNGCPSYQQQASVY
ncbi:hypothetical protein [Noviherbaspirillum denitrificans]|uniref:Uncharacterized protein n=1 Tax=Noviherbaspirillum denitrificans TaxID=1968433 RepID=A0A254THK4_9BURK|nr:hypothetical protein [Noviherbaspirillum denitrificans]OWW22130.1 hypothetical protein AYR66_24170 [Noviherbaspirillum denitrificans]